MYMTQCSKLQEHDGAVVIVIAWWFTATCVISDYHH